MRTPLLLALMFASLARALAADDPQPQIASISIERALPGVAVSTGVAPFPVAAEAQKFLASIGWKVEGGGGLVRTDGADNGRVAAVMIARGGLLWMNGDLVYAATPFPLEKDKTAAFLEGLANFTAVAAIDPAIAGATLAGWGLPPSHDGQALLNPDGSAAYEGLMLYQYFVAHPDAMKRASSERLSQAIGLFDSGYDYTFGKAAAPTGHADVKRAWSLLDRPARPGETLLALKPYPDLGKTLAKYKAQLTLSLDQSKDSTDPVVQGQRRLDKQALATLNSLEKQRYGRPLPKSGPPHDPTALLALLVATQQRAPEAYVPLSGGLPGLLKALDRVNGSPLTAEQQESLIRSFPMGDLVWRTGVQELWKQGLTGTGVKVAVIDEGVGAHPELNGAVKSREKFGDYPGQEMFGPHGMHVSGIIHQLAPDAEIRSYAVVPSLGRNPRFEDASDGVIIDAVRKAVADGNAIINMSISGGVTGPNHPVSVVVEEYAKRGIIFVICADNFRGSGIATPSISAGAITAGSLDANGRMSDFSSTGAVYDAKRLAYAVKDVFLAPGGNINSTLPGGYGAMSGTSMAAPALSGMISLLKQAASFSPAPDPIAASRNIRDALRAGSTPLSLNSLPPGVPLDQDFLVVDPLAALKRLDAVQEPVAKK